MTPLSAPIASASRLAAAAVARSMAAWSALAVVSQRESAVPGVPSRRLRDRVQAVILAYETGLVRPGEPDAPG